MPEQNKYIKKEQNLHLPEGRTIRTLNASEYVFYSMNTCNITNDLNYTGDSRIKK